MRFWAPVQTVTRVWAFVFKELVETIHRPAALVSLVAGPFLIMAIFGVGYSGVRRPLDTVLVIPPQTGLSTSPRHYQEVAGPAVRIVNVVTAPEGAMTALRQQKIDLVVIAPADAQQRLKAGKQATIKVESNVLDPVLANYVWIMGGQIQREVNDQITKQAVAAAEKNVPSGQPTIPPETVAQPTTVETDDIAPTEPKVIPFFGAAVFALILQHLGVTLTALSLVRERLSGAFEVFRVSPVSAFELLVGKYLAFGLVNAIIGAVVAGMLVKVFHVPFLGSPTTFAAVVALLTFASLGLGLLISIVSDSERQAVQLALLLLLASVFFSGFVLPIEEFIPAVRGAAYALPVTHGIRLIQDLMLRGSTTVWWEVGALAVIGLVCFVLTLFMARRSLAAH